MTFSRWGGRGQSAKHILWIVGSIKKGRKWNNGDQDTYLDYLAKEISVEVVFEVISTRV